MIGFRAPEGNGCRYCETGKPIVFCEGRAGTVSQCLECFMIWFPGKDVTWWEQRHTLFLDHIDEALKRDAEKREHEMLAALGVG